MYIIVSLLVVLIVILLTQKPHSTVTGNQTPQVTFNHAWITPHSTYQKTAPDIIRENVRKYTCFSFAQFTDDKDYINAVADVLEYWLQTGKNDLLSERFGLPEGMTKTDVMHFAKNINIEAKRSREEVAILFKSMFSAFEDDEISSMIARMNDRCRKHSIPILDKSKTLSDNLQAMNINVN